ncbi:MAG: S41 family peptidase [Rikenellaceae bacterium]|nr:S41 family peptidase [Rikenellaceae bacterium]
MRGAAKHLVRTLVLILILSVGWFAGLYFGRQLTDNQLRIYLNNYNAQNDKLSRVLMMIENEYIDSISRDSLTELAIPAILKKLDPHSVYLPPKEFEQADEPLQGEFDGIGVVFNMATDTVIVLNVIPSGPSRKAGVLGGDRIIKVNDTLIAGQKWSQTAVMKRLRGPRGTQVKLSIERKGIDGLVDIVVTRDAIPLHSVEASMMMTDKIGFIKLSQFSRTSYAEIKKALLSLRAQGMKSLILDLRGNSGGFLDQAILIANEFLPAGALIVYTEDRNGKQMRQYSDGRGGSTDLKMAVLIDEASASSSEILAGALQDNDRGTIVGRRSFGKGLVQQQTPFEDGSALRLTVARYYTPTGRSIQKPYTAGDGESYEHDLIDRFKRNEFFSADSIHFADSLRYTTPKGKVVYGGGGIMPDVFVPLDTLNVTRYYSEVSGRNILYRYTIEYADNHRKELSEAKSMRELKRLLDNDTALLNDFVRYAERQGVKPNWREIGRSRQIIEAQLRAFISRNSNLEDNAFYYFIRPIDSTMLRAIEELQAER